MLILKDIPVSFQGTKPPKNTFLVRYGIRVESLPLGPSRTHVHATALSIFEFRCVRFAQHKFSNLDYQAADQHPSVRYGESPVAEW